MLLVCRVLYYKDIQICPTHNPLAAFKAKPRKEACQEKQVYSTRIKEKHIRKGEPRVSGESIQELLALSQSPEPEERRFAAEFLCPGHVRRRIDEVCDALYRMLEDPELKVRKAA